MNSDVRVARQLAMQEQGRINERRRQNLLPVARDLRNPQLAVEIIEGALRQIGLWRARKLCSHHYIEAWEALLEQPEEAARVLEDQSSLWSVQLRQNSPFVSTVRKNLAAQAGAAESDEVSIPNQE